MAAPEDINADMLAFWNGKGGHTWVARQEHTDITLTPVTDALLGFAAPRAGERVVDIGCGCGAPTLEFARAVGPSGRVVGFDISGPMLAEGERRASAPSSWPAEAHLLQHFEKPDLYSSRPKCGGWPRYAQREGHGRGAT
jgi:SAM-dependent methyltransferase